MKETTIKECKRDVMSEVKFYSDYSRFDESKERYETWDESVERVIGMHRTKYAEKINKNDELKKIIDRVEQGYKDKLFIAAQRSLQFGGEQILKNNAKMYNCCSTYADRVDCFGGFGWFLLSGSGVGVSVQKHHVKKLPKTVKRDKGIHKFVIQDSIEGWADAWQILIASYLQSTKKQNKFHKYSGYEIEFDFSLIRPKGAKISGGFLAPGHEPLEKSLKIMDNFLSNISKEKSRKLKPIEVYDLLMWIADAVISGGVRRSATIVLFSKDDDEMFHAKSGENLMNNQQRFRSNNSVVLLRDKCTKKDFEKIVNFSTENFGEPGFYFVDDLDASTNPCLTGDSWVTTKEGPKQIVDLAGKGKQTLLVNGEWKDTTDHGFVKTRSDSEIIHLTLKNGMDIKCTPDHKIMTKDGWKEASDLETNDFIRISNKKLEFSQLEKSEYIECEDVYDCCVPDGNAFEANGIIVHNCVEIGMYPQHIDENGESHSGFQTCNLSDINGKMCDTQNKFYEACELASAIGTLQAGYTHFPYFEDDITKKIIEKEALIGVSINGYYHNPDILFDPEVLRKGAKIVLETNKKVAKMIGINPAARTTTTKPSGNSSTMLGLASGIHADHSKRFLRRVTLSDNEQTTKYISKLNPQMVTKGKNQSDSVSIAFPVVNDEKTVTKSDINALEFLSNVKLAYENWILEGTDVELCVNKTVRHNISNTAIVKPDERKDVIEFLYENKHKFSGVSMFGPSMDKDYNQAPFTEVLTENELIDTYGKEAIAFGMSVWLDSQTIHDDLWDAINDILFENDTTEMTNDQKNWISDFKHFANKYFDGDLKMFGNLLKDIHLIDEWSRIQMEYKPMNFQHELKQREFIEVDTMGAQACSGGACELTF